MALKILLYFTLAFASVLAKKLPKRHKMTMEWRMEVQKIVPYVFPAGPGDSAFIKYEFHGVRGRPNEILSHEDAAKKPQIYWNALTKARYTLAMVLTDYTVSSWDSDYYNEYVHWLVVNIPGRRIRYGRAIVNYNIPPRPYNNGTSFLVFLIYKQDDRFNKSVIDRKIINDGSFRIFDFCFHRNMKYPDAGMFFRLRYDVYANRTTTEATLPTTKRKRKIKKKH